VIEAEQSDCAFKDETAVLTFEADDAKPCNTENVLKNVRRLFYEWNSEKGIQFRRGRALVFYDNDHRSYAMELGNSFYYLDYKTEFHTLKDLNKVTGKEVYGNN